MSTRTLVREYYTALDEGDYDALRELLAPEFTQERGDRTFGSRDAFVSFMRDDRPRFDTRHDVDTVYDGPDGDRAVAGRLIATDDADAADAGTVLFEYLDVFEIESGRIVGLRTFVDGS